MERVIHGKGEGEMQIEKRERWKERKREGRQSICALTDQEKRGEERSGEERTGEERRGVERRGVERRGQEKRGEERRRGEKNYLWDLQEVTNGCI